MLNFLKSIFGKLNLLNITKKITSRFNFISSVVINNRKFKIPIIKNIGYDNLTFVDGLWKVDIFKKLLKFREGTFVDIGINIGQTLIALKALNNKVKYIGFEPNSTCIFYVNNLIKINDFKYTTIIPIGLFSNTDIFSFDVAGEADQGGSIINDLRPGYHYTDKTFVPVFKLDSIYKKIEINDTSIIKIDVEGAEFGVLEGMRSFIMSQKPIIICEILWAHNKEKLKDVKLRNESIEKFLKEVNYTLLQIIKTEKNDKVEKFVKIDKLENQVYTTQNREFCDYLMVNNAYISTIKKILE